MRHHLRSLLAALGLAAGVAAVVFTVALGASTRDRMLARFSAMGDNLITVQARRAMPTGARAGGGLSRQTLTPGDSAAISRLEGAARSEPLVSSMLRVQADGVAADTLVIGARPGQFALEKQSLAGGRFFSSRENKLGLRVAVVGASLSNNLTGGDNMAGRRITIKKQPFLVVGQLLPKGPDPDGNDLDDRVYIPLQTALSRLLGGQRYVHLVMVQADGPSEIEEVKSSINRLLRTRHRIGPGGREDFRIISQAEAIQAREKVQGLFTLLTVGVASLSLLVGGIGIMAVMLISIRERTSEIGVRRAVGGRRRDIQAQFLMEALLLGMAGGGAGSLTGLVLAWGLSLGASHSFSMPWQAAAWSAAVGMVIAAMFGFWPARRAAGLKPVDCLRG